MNITFASLLEKALQLVSSEKSDQTVLFEITTLLEQEVAHYNWVGFYTLDKPNAMLRLGPFSGLPTEHTEIPVGKGVCGQVALSLKPKIVQDVRKEDNYIACSLDVKSEIVIPILKNGEFVAEIDIDSNTPSPFTADDEQFLVALCDALANRF
jgi:GAF domain-containing protein